MNRSCEWEKFFDETDGRYRYRHKGTGLICNTLVAIGRAFAGPPKNVAKPAAKKAAKTVAEKVGQKVGEIADKKVRKKSRKFCKSASRGRGSRRKQKGNLK